MSDTITRILVPVDFSPQSERALRYAVTVAGLTGAAIEMLHVVADPFMSGAWNPEIYVPNVQGLLTTVITDAQQRLDVLRATAGTSGVVATVICGQPADLIVERAKSGHFDLIVMGTHGRSGLSHIMVGSVAERVIRRADCPVLTLRLQVDMRRTATAAA